MKIFLNSYQPQFKSSSSFYKTEKGKEIGTFTWFFRKDLDWQAFIKYQIEHFKDKENVNIIQFGASDGSEAYTYIMSLLESTSPEETEKFFPIKAYDIKDTMVKIANNGYINIFADDETRMNNNNIRWRKYFDRPEVEPYQYINTTLYKVRNKLINRVNFNQGNMFELLPRINDNSNTIVMCRNCLGYFPEKIEQFIQTASQVLKKDSLFVVGLLELDEPYLEDILRKNNFQKVMLNVFKKL